MALGTNLKEILKQKNMTIKDLSKKAGISVNTLYSITKRDGKMARFDIIKKICETLEIKESELLGFDVQPEDYEEQNSRRNLRVYEVHRNSDLRNGYISNIPPTQKELIQAFTGMVEDITDNNKHIELLSHFDNLNDTGKEKAIEQVELLTKIPEYKKDPGNDNQDQE
ncbi:Predicted transcriptional regulator [uncultured Eubacterium sp.]|nr:Predicted transcriptional regulator [uncultured Eubacterium sp.]